MKRRPGSCSLSLIPKLCLQISLSMSLHIASLILPHAAPSACSVFLACCSFFLPISRSSSIAS